MAGQDHANCGKRARIERPRGGANVGFKIAGKVTLQCHDGTGWSGFPGFVPRVPQILVDVQSSRAEDAIAVGGLHSICPSGEALARSESITTSL